VLENPQLILDQRESLRVNFLNRLTAQERQVADMLAQFPYDTTQTIAEYLHKSPRTVERQLSDIYAKMSDAYDFVDQISDKRQALINIMLGR
jgi:DNA-binding CsgD family transcriptional regulator